MPNPGDEWAAGDIPPEPEMTPEKLREDLQRLVCRFCEMVGYHTDDCLGMAILSAWETDRTHIEALVQALPAKDAEGLARVCISFAGEMLHKQDDIGQRLWTEQAKRLRGYAALAAKSPTPKPTAPKPQILTTGWPADKETPNG